MDQLLRLSPIGLNTDVLSSELGGAAYQGVDSMVARVGKMQRASGYAEIWPTPLFDPYWLLYTPQALDHYWLYAGVSNIAWTRSDGTHTDITAAPFTNLADPYAWTGGNLNGVAVINSPENDPFYWVAGNATITLLPGLRANTRYQVMRPFKYHLIGLGYTDASGAVLDGLHWSDAADPGNVPSTWAPAEDNEAGDNVLSDENGPIIDGMALRDAFYIYKQDTIYEMVYIGGNEVFRFNKVFGTVGVLAANCIVRVKGSHVVLGNGDIYRHDGQNIESICTGRVRDEFFRRIDREHYAKSYVIYNEKSEQVAFCVPEVGSDRVNIALVWNASTNEFGYDRIPRGEYGASGIVADTSNTDASWDGDASAWDVDSSPWDGAPGTLDTTEESVLFAQADERKLQLTGFGETADGAAFGAGVTVTGIDAGEPQVLKAWRRLWTRLEAPDGFQYKLTLYCYERPDDPPTMIQTIENYDPSEGIPLNVNSRYFGLTLESDQQVPWSVSGYDIEYGLKGHF